MFTTRENHISLIGYHGKSDDKFLINGETKLYMGVLPRPLGIKNQAIVSFNSLKEKCHF
jgi:hypothetical protein